jgi:hypothetical protein
MALSTGQWYSSGSTRSSSLLALEVLRSMHPDFTALTRVAYDSLSVHVKPLEVDQDAVTDENSFRPAAVDDEL